MGLEINLWAKLRLSTLPLALRQPFKVITMGSDFFEVKGAQILLQPEVFEHVQGAAPQIVRTLMDRYYLGLLVSLCSILGSSSLFALPALPIKWGRKGINEAMRAVNFMIHRSSDIFQLLTLDDAYIQRKRIQNQERLQEITGLRSGLSTAALHLGSGLLHITDIVREPIAGAREGGVTGFIHGIAKGFLGSTVKPIAEFGFSARAVTQGLRLKLKQGHGDGRKVMARRRPPRVMYVAGGIREYDEAAALLTLEVATAVPVPGSSLKDRAAIEQARYGITDHVLVMRTGATPYVKHLLLLLTPTQLLLVDLGSNGIAVRWSLLLSHFCGVRASSHGVIVWSDDYSGVGSSPDERVAHQIPCEDADVIQLMFRMLHVLPH